MNEFEGKTWVGLQAEKMHAKVPHGGTPMAEQDRDDKGRFSVPGGGGGGERSAFGKPLRKDPKPAPSRQDAKSSEAASHASTQALNASKNAKDSSSHTTAAQAHSKAADAHETAANTSVGQVDRAQHQEEVRYHRDAAAEHTKQAGGGLSDEEKSFFREENKRDPHGDKEGYGRGPKK